MYWYGQSLDYAYIFRIPSLSYFVILFLKNGIDLFCKRKQFKLHINDWFRAYFELMWITIMYDDRHFWFIYRISTVISGISPTDPEMAVNKLITEFCVQMDSNECVALFKKKLSSFCYVANRNCKCVIVRYQSWVTYLIAHAMAWEQIKKW